MVECRRHTTRRASVRETVESLMLKTLSRSVFSVSKYWNYWLQTRCSSSKVPILWTARTVALLIDGSPPDLAARPTTVRRVGEPAKIGLRIAGSCLGCGHAAPPAVLELLNYLVANVRPRRDWRTSNPPVADSAVCAGARS